MERLTPKKCKEICNKIDCEQSFFTPMFCGRPITQYLRRLAELETEIECGWLIKKVFNVGDTVYSPALANGKHYVVSDIVEKVIIAEGEITYKLQNEATPVYSTRLFATQELAQARADGKI